MIRIRAAALLAAVTTVTLGAPAFSAAAADAAPRDAAPRDAAIRAAHYSPTTPGVDVYLSRFAGGKAPGKLWLSKITYGTVSKYQPLTPGLYSVAMRRAGAAASSPPMLTWTLNARDGAAYTVAGVGADSAVRGVVVKDDLTAPPAGQGRIRIVQAASRAPVASVSADNGTVIADDVRFASVTGYTTMPSGRWTVTATAAGGGRSGRSTGATAQSASTRVAIEPGQTTSILLLDGKASGIVLRSGLDSSSAGNVPRSSVDAGAGGTAPEADRTDGAGTGTGSAGNVAALSLAGISLAGVLSAGVVALRRRRRTG